MGSGELCEKFLKNFCKNAQNWMEIMNRIYTWG